MSNTGVGEAGINARVINRGLEHVPPDIARYILDLHFPEADKNRMHDLAVSNQADALTFRGKTRRIVCLSESGNGPLNPQGQGSTRSS